MVGRHNRGNKRLQRTTQKRTGGCINQARKRRIQTERKQIRIL